MHVCEGFHRTRAWSRATVASAVLTMLVSITTVAMAKGNGQHVVPTVQQMSLLPLAFTRNDGQWDKRAQFRAQANGATMWFTEEGVYYHLQRRVDDEEPQGLRDLYAEELSSPDATRTGQFEQRVIKASLLGSNPHPRITAENLMGYKCNWFIGNNPKKWHTDVPNYAALIYKEVYSGIDVRYRGNGKQIEHDFIIAPGADPSQIELRYDGAQSVTMDRNGDLIVVTDFGELVERIPKTYQERDGHLEPVSCCYEIIGENTVRFLLDEGFDRSLALVIDPVTLVYSTYLGGNASDIGNGIAVDASGNAYVVGYTHSTNFPTADPYQIDTGQTDVFVTKLNTLGSAPVYSTYIGGPQEEEGNAIAVDGGGSAYITGVARHSFPTSGSPYQTYQGGPEAFVTKLNPQGNDLDYSTYLGGTQSDAGNGIAIDASGNAYVTGYTTSSNFPTTAGAWQTTYADGADAFVTKLNPTGGDAVYSTFLGGSGGELAEAIAVDGSGNAYVTGNTGSSNFPVVNPYQLDEANSFDGFVTKVNEDGTDLLYSTYLGGDGYDQPLGIAVDGAGSTYITGTTQSTNFPTVGPYQSDQGSEDVFVTKLNADGSNSIYSTYLGGEGQDRGYGIAVDAVGNATVVGWTTSYSFPTVHPYQTRQGSGDVFVTELNPTGSGLEYSTYLGGSDGEQAWGIALDGGGDAYVTGSTLSTNFPTVDPPYQTYQGVWDAFVAKIEGINYQVGFFATPRAGAPPLTAFFDAAFEAPTPPDNWVWEFGDGNGGVGENPVHRYTQTGLFSVSVTATFGAIERTVTFTDYIDVNTVRAEFSAAPRHGFQPHQVTFADLSLGSPTSWFWEFGDGEFSSDQRPTHTYTFPGLYDVTLTVYDAINSDAETKLSHIRVDALAPDLVVTAYGHTQPRRGFDKCYSIFLENVGTDMARVSEGASLRFEMPPQTSHVSHEPPGGSVTGNVVEWPIGAIPPGADPVRFRVCVNTPTSVTNGTVLRGTASVTHSDGEVNVTNNVDIDDETVVAAIDPNDLFVQPEGCGAGKDLIQGTPALTYTVLFENKPEATAEAIYVLIVDTLDPDLDWGTLQIGPTVKDDVLTVDFDPVSGELSWFFDGIDLPPNVTPPQGEGFVAYTISPKPGLADGTVISSRAHIRFDFEDWLSAPEAGPLNLTVMPCPSCACNCHADPVCDAVINNVQDVVVTINVAFRGAAAIPDPNGSCPLETTDVNCDTFTSVIDVVKVVNVAFRSANAATEYCNPCP